MRLKPPAVIGMQKVKKLSELPCANLQGVGPQLTQRLEKLGIVTIQDLLFHLPLRYEDRTRIVPIAHVRPTEHVLVEGTIIQTQLRFGKRRSFLCALQDNTGCMTLRFFHFTQAQKAQLEQKNANIRCFGEVRFGTAGFEMVHPEYRFVNKETLHAAEESLTPIYPTTEGLQQRTFRQLTSQALQYITPSASVPTSQKPGITGDLSSWNSYIDEYLPAELLQQFSLPDLNSAIRYIHRPPPDAPRQLLTAGLHPTQQRLAFEELLAHQLSLQKRRLTLQQCKAPVFSENAEITTRFLKRLPFSLTNAQQRVISEIKNDLVRNFPMLRLVQGDVGSGKTVVAAMAALQAIHHHYQVALMAPTELLAEQHTHTLSQWLSHLGIQVTHLTGGLKAAERTQALSALASGQSHLAIGTHALFQKDIQFARLGLVIIDEQHRFGVHQRLELREKGRYLNEYPHQLIMTATPIPRTLAMTAYADLDISQIDELPPGRKPIITVLVSNQRRDEVISRIAQICAKGQQVYWVCTLIEESEVLQCQAAEAQAVLLKEQLPQLRLGLIHGRLKTAEKEQLMTEFKAGKIHLLVATTVIEVGVDVPNATLMVIENAERLGLAQLHQLRGRIGRGNTESYCVLLYQTPLSSLAKKRLQVLKNHQSGFDIAQQDLELRGPGDVLGTRQAGLMVFKIANLLRDKALLPAIQKASQKLMQTYPQHVEPLIHRWIGKDEKYGDV